MLTLGLLSIHFEQEVEYFTEIAKRATDFHIKVVRFRPSDLRPDKRSSITGLSYQQKWQSDTFPLPPYIYDRCFHHNDKYKPVVNWLKKQENITFLGYGLPNKLAIADILFCCHKLHPHIPPTQKALHPDQILQQLDSKKKILLKQVYGAGGRGIYFLTKENGKIKIQTQQGTKIFTKTFSDCTVFLEKLLAKQDYIMQPYLSLTDDSHAPFDIRILLQKNEHGKWEQRGIGMRKGRPYHFISNLSGGSSIEPYHQKNETLTEMVQIIPKVLEEKFPPLFELGLDFGFDRQNHLWLLDVNSKPGRKVALKANPENSEKIYTAPLAYCRFLQRQEGNK